MPRGRSSSPARLPPASSSLHVGSSVLARWPGSNLYYPATITSQLSSGRYDVQFQDDSSSTFTIAAIYVLPADSRRMNRRKSASKSQSPGRRRRSRSRSPARKQSPGRTQSDGRPKGRARKSPAKKTTSEGKTASSDKSAAAGGPIPIEFDSSAVSGGRRRSTRTGEKAAAAAGEDVSSLAFGQKVATSATSPQLSPAEDRKTTDADTTTADGPARSPRLEASPSDRDGHKANFEFGGPFGALFTMISLPIAILALFSVCNPTTCNVKDIFTARLPPVQTLFSVKAVLVVMGWLLFHALLYMLPIGTVVQGQKLRSGSRLPYRISAFYTFLITVVVFITAVFHGHRIGLPLDPVYVYDNYLQLAVASILVSFALSVFLYAYSCRDGVKFAEGGNTGIPIYDFFIGRELNPRIGEMFDLKIFCELRPGLIAWIAINFCMAYTQYVKHGYVSNSMILVNVFQFLYVADGLVAEKAILTTMDIISDGFGYMLAFGDLAWVPFVYTLQARYLVDRPESLQPWAVAFLLGLNMLGFYIFRAANGQKDLFRSQPHHASFSHLYTIPTSHGRELLADGWWGMSRHPNYLGDLMMGLAWCGTCGVNHIICYFYIIYFAILLVHRQRRDDLHCERKYGAAWQEYMQRVPYKIIPGFY